MNKLVNSTLLLLAFVCFPNLLEAQARDFDGLWSGKINKDDGTSFDLEIYIDDNNVYATYIDEDGDLAKDLSKEVIWSKGYAEHLNFVWINSGGVWTETQMISLVWISSTKLSVHFLRHVSNESDDYEGNTDWGYYGTGYLYQE